LIYFDATGQVGIGPLPPKVGAATTYRLDWILRNTLHELRNIKVSATLPLDVEWTGVMNNRYGELTYDPGNRLIVWTINRLPLTLTKVDTNFNLRLNPTSQHLGATMPVISKTTVVAQDVETNKEINKNFAALDSATENDTGVVVEANQIE